MSLVYMTPEEKAAWETMQAEITALRSIISTMQADLDSLRAQAFGLARDLVQANRRADEAEARARYLESVQ